MNKIDSIRQKVDIFFSEFIDFKSGRSYVTGKNKSKTITDNYAGDFVVADFNPDYALEL